MRRLSALIFFCLVMTPVLAQDATCTYSTYRWNAREKVAVEHTEVVKSYADLSAEEIDPASGCSVCREDQVWLSLAGIPGFQVCRYVAKDIERALYSALDAGQEIVEIVGYRVGKTRGVLDSRDLRTEFSNHSYGTAIDINPARNGLYDNCLRFGDRCILLRGGHWRPGHHLSLHAGSPAVTAMKMAGFNWGGEIAGKQKDFMHFSFTGY